MSAILNEFETRPDVHFIGLPITDFTITDLIADGAGPAALFEQYDAEEPQPAARAVAADDACENLYPMPG